MRAPTSGCPPGRAPPPAPRPLQQAQPVPSARKQQSGAGTRHWHARATLGARQGWPRGAGLGAPVCGMGSGSAVTKGRWVPWLGRAFGSSRPPGLAGEWAASPAGVASSPWCQARTAARGLGWPRPPAPSPAPRPGVVSLLLQRKKKICSCT